MAILLSPLLVTLAYIEQAMKYADAKLQANLKANVVIYRDFPSYHPDELCRNDLHSVK